MTERNVGGDNHPSPKRRVRLERRDVLKTIGGLMLTAARPVGLGVALSEAFHALKDQGFQVPQAIREAIMLTELERMGFEIVPFSPDVERALGQNPHDNSELANLQAKHQISQVAETAANLHFGLNLLENTTSELRTLVLPKESNLEFIHVCTYGDGPIIYRIRNSNDGIPMLGIRQVASGIHEPATISRSVVFVSRDLSKFRTPNILERLLAKR